MKIGAHIIDVQSYHLLASSVARELHIGSQSILTRVSRKACTVNGVRYQAMLEEEFIPVIREQNKLERYWFMQDGALPHRTNAVFE